MANHQFAGQIANSTNTVYAGAKRSFSNSPSAAAISAIPLSQITTSGSGVHSGNKNKNAVGLMMCVTPLTKNAPITTQLPTPRRVFVGGSGVTGESGVSGEASAGMSAAITPA